MKLITCAAVVALTIMSCHKHKSSDDAQPSPNKVEEDGKGEIPSTPETPKTPETPRTPETVVQPNKYEAYVSANYASESAEDQKLLVAELSAKDAAAPSQDLSVFKRQLDEVLMVSKGRASIRTLMDQYYTGFSAEFKAQQLAAFEAWMVDNVPASAINASPYTEENFDLFLDSQE